MFWWTVPIYYIMEEEKATKGEVIGVEDVRWKAGYTIQYVMDQMLYPQARYFTPNGTCKNSICWNGPWNMSALAEGSLAVLELAVWLWGSCVVSCTPWAERERDAAMAVWQQGCGSRSLYHFSESPRGGRRGAEREKKDSSITWSPCCWMSVWWRDCKSPLLQNVTKGAICIQLQHLLLWMKIIMVSKLLDRCVTSWYVL